MIVGFQQIKQVLITVQSRSQRLRDSSHSFTELRHAVSYLMQALNVVTSVVHGVPLVRTPMLINPAMPLHID